MLTPQNFSNGLNLYKGISSADQSSVLIERQLSKHAVVWMKNPLLVENWLLYDEHSPKGIKISGIFKGSLNAKTDQSNTIFHPYL